LRPRRQGRAPPMGRSRPVRQGRAPLRLHQRDRELQGREVVPSAKDGLHCGPVGRADHRRCGGASSRPPRTGSIAAGPFRGFRLVQPEGRPVRQGRAPLRPDLVVQRASCISLSSRPPRTGSIAASRRAPGRCSSSRSSRPPRTGSIAARRTICLRRKIPRRPVRQGRAPLRRLLRRGAPVPQQVVPSAKDGLHCGSRESGHCALIMMSSRPPRTGSIAADGSA